MFLFYSFPIIDFFYFHSQIIIKTLINHLKKKGFLLLTSLSSLEVIEENKPKLKAV